MANQVVRPTSRREFMDKLIEKYGESNVTPYKLLKIYEEGL